MMNTARRQDPRSVDCSRAWRPQSKPDSPHGGKTAIYLVEPNPILRKIIVEKFKNAAGIRLIQIHGEERTPVPASSRAGQVLLIDRGTLGAKFRAELQQLKLSLPASKIAIIDVEAAKADLALLIQLGVHGFLSYERLDKELLPAIISLSRDGLWFSSEVLEHYVKKSVDSLNPGPKSSGQKLTPRQEQILSILKRGCSNKEIGVLLGISESTVKFHVAKLFGKLGICDRRTILVVPCNNRNQATTEEISDRPSGELLGERSMLAS